MDINTLQSQVKQIAQLIGLFTGPSDNLSFNTGWFKTPVTDMEQIPNRMNDLVALIDGFLGTKNDDGPAVFADAEWYNIPNPETGNATPFYFVATAAAQTTGQLGIGLFAPYTDSNLKLVPYIYVPILSYSPTGTSFILGSANSACQVGLNGSPISNNFSVGNGAGGTITFTQLNLVANIFLSGAVPTISLDFGSLQGASFASPVTTLAVIKEKEVLACMGEVLLQAANWPTTAIGESKITIGQVLTAAGFLTDNGGTYSLDLANLNSSPEAIALNFVSNALGLLADNKVPIITLPDGGVYVQTATTGTVTQYGLQLVAGLQLTTGETTPSIELCLGTGLSGETDTSNWMTRTASPTTTLPPAGVSVWLMNKDGSNYSFVPAFSVCNVGVNIGGGGKDPLFNKDGYTMKDAELRATVNPVDITNPATWTYGFAAKLDQLGFPMLPNPSSGDSPTKDPVAQSLLQSSNDTAAASAPAGDQAPANPTFGIAASWYAGGTFDLQLFDADNKPADEVDFPINRQLGPLNCQQIDVGWENASHMLSILFDGSVALGPLKISLQGLTVGIPMATPATLSNYTLDLQGLGLQFNAGSVSMTGAFVKVPAPPNGYTEYDGTVTIQAGKFALSALGSYAYVPATTSAAGFASMFIYGVLLAPLGGPEFFFVTGLAAGFGYNRAINLPTQDAVPNFPFVAVLNDPSTLGGTEVNGAWTFPDPAAVLAKIDGVVPPQRGEYWFAAGVRFTSFDLINTSALLTVEFGNELEIGVTGISWMSLPVPAANSTASTTQFAYVELGIDIQVLPSEGMVAATAILTPNSYVIDPNCHLTGGFAFYVWFGNNPYSGQFVLTIGGYNASFNAPSYFPQVPRLGFNWQVDEYVTISGDAYFALTPSAIMAGGGLSILFADGNLKAWFIAQMDALVQWAPFQYNFYVSISIGVSYKLNLLFTSITLKVELGASVNIWGPNMGGKAHISWYIISFSVPFGADAPAASVSLDWTTADGKGFADTLLPNKSNAGSPFTTVSTMAMVSSGTHSSTLSILTIAPIGGVMSTYTSTTASDGHPAGTAYWIVRPASFSFSALTAFPTTELNIAPAAGESAKTKTNWLASEESPVGTNYQVNVRPMNATVSSSNFQLSLTCDDDNNAVYDLAKDFDISLSLVSGPAAKWGPLLAPNAPPESNTLLPELLMGFESLAPAITTLTPNGADALTIDITAAFVDEVVDPGVTVLPLSATAQPSGAVPVVNVNSWSTSWATIQSVLADAQIASTRAEVFNTLNTQFGMNLQSNGPLTAMAAQPGEFLNGYPMIL